MKKNPLYFPLLLVFAEIATYLSNDMYLPALPNIMRELQITQAQVQLTLSSWFLGAASMQLLVGPLTDRFGRRPIIIIGMLLLIISSLVCALTNNLIILILARFFQGTTVCFVIVAGYATIHELYHQTTAIRILALMSSMTVLAPALGPFLGGLLMRLGSWRWSFWLLFIWGCVATSLLIKYTPEPLSAKKRMPLKISQVLSQYWKILTNRRFLLLMSAFSAIFCGFIAWIAVGPFYVIDQFHYSPLVFGYLQILIFFCFIASNHLINYLIERMPINQLIHIGMIITLAGGLVAFYSALFWSQSLSGVVIGMMIFSFGSGFSFAPLQRLAIESTKEPMGSRMAIVSTFISGSGLLASLLVSVFYDGKLFSFANILILTSLLAGIFYTCVKGRRVLKQY